jgi:alanine racemase
MIDISRPSKVEIDLGSLRHNIRMIRSWVGDRTRLMAVVKADAYGHGSVKVAEAAAGENIDFLGVALLEEADEIKKAGVGKPIVILYPESPERAADAVKKGYHVTLSDPHDLRELREIVGRNNFPIKYFLNANTGMNRYGGRVDEATLSSALDTKDNGSVFMGITTNLADSGKSNPDLAERQVGDFLKIMKSAGRFSDNGLLYSYESSGSVWRRREAEGSMVRIGLLMYGVAPSKKAQEELRPVMSVKSRIAEIHDVGKGEGVGYDFSFVAASDSRVAVIPMGYADGMPWSLSNNGSVIVRGSEAPIIGRVCMDAFMIDVTDIASCSRGDEVVILGSMGKVVIDAHRLGDWAGSFAYEILSGWSKRLPRYYK